MFHLIKPGTNIDFVGKRKLWMGLSVVFIFGTVALFFAKGLNYGIDFTGGAEVHIQVPNDWDIGKVREEMTRGGVHGVRVQQIGDPAANEFLVRAQGEEKQLNAISKQVEDILTAKMSKDRFQIKRVDVVGPAAGGLLRKNGFLAMFYAFLVILIYVAVRFDTRYAPGAVLALVHDSVITIGVFILTQKQFDLTILAAILALIGYSNNDTIIVYDRVRETVHLHPELDIDRAVNRAINETLGRTIITSLCTFITVFTLWLMGGPVIENFAFTLMVGIIVGTYSSVFIASSAIIMITHYQKNQQLKLRANGSVPSKKSRSARPEPKFEA